MLTWKECGTSPFLKFFSKNIPVLLTLPLLRDAYLAGEVGSLGLNLNSSYAQLGSKVIRLNVYD